jgi:plasmid stabilization system protein ParE
MLVELLAGAEADMFEAYARLSEISERRAERFYDALQKALTQLGDFPESAPRYRDRIRRLVLTGFGIGIFYVVEANKVCVGAILDLRQGQDKIERRFLP